MKKISENYSDIRKHLFTCLNQAGSILKRGFGSAHSIRFKSPISIVTEIDMAAEKKIVGLIQRRFPSHPILTEESLPFAGTSSYRWIIDPLDGTTNYAHGIGICAVSIGVEHQGHIIMGGVYNPISNELFFAEKGKGAFLNNKKIKVSKSDKLIESLMVTGFPYDRQKKIGYYLKFVEKIVQQTRGLRRLGAAAIDLCYVACGKFDAFWEFNLQPWDVAAGVLIVEEAGGKVSDLLGQPINVDKPSNLLASNGILQKPILSLFKNLFRSGIG